MVQQYREIRDILAKQRLDGLFGQGASEEQIRDCEEILNLRLPRSFRQFLEEYGWGYFGSLELIAGLGADIPKEWCRGANILQIVNDERRGPLQIPKTVIPFCQNGAGDWYALDCTNDDGDESPVVLIAHETVAASGFVAEKCADSFAEWILGKLSGGQTPD
jgi:hypothetical protein